MNGREQWGTRAGFILAAVGSAVGLGNIWRFPYVAYANGGGAFFLPYLFALLTAGIPLLIMEFTIGHKFRGAAPTSYGKLGKEWIGWWQVAISFVIATYYSVIIAWAMSYTRFAFGGQWGEETGGFLIGEYLQRGEVAGEITKLIPGVLIPLIIVWVVTLGVLFKGVKKGIEIANKIFIPTLVVMFLMIVIRALTLEGATMGLDALFKPDWSSMLDGKVWVAAYGQIFFSLSIGFAIMITYSSYLPKKSDINNNAFIAGFSNSGFELLAGIGVFAALGFMANAQGVDVDQVADGGIGLAFIVFPQIINTFPGFNTLFGVLFFGSLVLAGLSSLISIVQTYVAALQEKFNISRTKAVLFGGGLSAVLSIVFATDSGLDFLDVVDYFINSFGIVLAGLVSVVAIAWFVRNLDELQNHANAVSDLKTGLWWKLCLSVVTPLVLGYMLFDSLRQTIIHGYGIGRFTLEFNFYWGWLVAIAVFVFGVLFSIQKKENQGLANTAEKTSKGVNAE